MNWPAQIKWKQSFGLIPHNTVHVCVVWRDGINRTINFNSKLRKEDTEY